MEQRKDKKARKNIEIENVETETKGGDEGPRLEAAVNDDGHS